MKNGLITMLAMVVLAGCGAMAGGEVGTDAHAADLAQQGIENMLKDADSAKFTGLYVIRAREGADGRQSLYTCGYVNARNGFGGYAGDSRFVVEQALNKKLGTFSNVYAWIESYDNRKAIPRSMSSTGASEFEYLAWNKYCTDGVHRATFTGAD